MGTHRHRRHSTELKFRLVQVYLSGEASLNGLARELDISRNLIRVRVDKFRKGNPCDKAMAESSMKTLKHGEILACEHETMRDVIGRLPRFIEEVQNRRRLHSSNGYLPPGGIRTRTCPAGGLDRRPRRSA